MRDGLFHHCHLIIAVEKDARGCRLPQVAVCCLGLCAVGMCEGPRLLFADAIFSWLVFTGQLIISCDFLFFLIIFLTFPVQAVSSSTYNLEYLFFRCLMKWITEELKIGTFFFPPWVVLEGACSELPPQLTSYWLVAAAHYYTSSVS